MGQMNLKSLLLVLEKRGQHQAKQLQRQIYVNDRIKNMNESIYYTVDTLHTAIAENKQIEFQYCIWSVDKKLIPKKAGELFYVPWDKEKGAYRIS